VHFTGRQALPAWRCHPTAPPHSSTGPLRQTRLQESTWAMRPVSFAAAARPAAELANGRACAVAAARPSASTPAVVIVANRVTVSSFVIVASSSLSARVAENGLRWRAAPQALMQINGGEALSRAVPRDDADRPVRVHGGCDLRHIEFDESRLMWQPVDPVMRRLR
jgi:hypothetical protein